MDISGEYHIAAPRERVWAALNDPAILRACIPGCRSLERVSPGSMRGSVDFTVGALQATLVGTLTQSEIDPPRACRLVVAGEATTGAVSGTVDVSLAEENGGTRIRYVIHGNVTGKFGEVGPLLLETTARRVAERFFHAFAARVGEGAVARAEHAVGEAAHEVAVVARDAEEKAEVAAGRGFLGGPQVWALIVLAVIIAFLLIFR